MASSDKTVDYGLTADPSGFEKGMQAAANATRQFSEEANNNFKKVQDAFANVQRQITILAGMVAGGTFFKEAIGASNEFTTEVVKLQRALGMDAEAAGALNTSLKAIGSDSDSYISTFTRFARQIKSNEQGLNDLGVKTRDSNGHLRDANTLYTEALQSVGQYKSGLDQNIYAQTLFGKNIDDVMKLQKLNNKLLDESREKNEALGLIVTRDNVEGSKAYTKAMAGVNEVMLATQKAVGDGVMPVFTDLAQYFANTGPAVVDVFKRATLGLVTVFELIKAAVRTMAAAVFETFNMIVDVATHLGETVVKLIKGDYQGAYEAGKAMGERYKQGVLNVIAEFQDAGQMAGESIMRTTGRLFGPQQWAPRPKVNGDDTGGKKLKEDKSRTSQWEAELAEAKLHFQEEANAAGTFYQFTKQQELEFWRAKLALTKDGTAENLAVRTKAAQLELGIRQDEFNAVVGSLQAQEAAYKQNTAAKLALLDQEAAIVRQRYGEGSKEYEQVQRRITEVKRQATEQQLQIDQMAAQSARDMRLAEVQAAEQQAQLQRDLHYITDADLLQKQAQFEQQKFQIALDGLNQRLQLALKDPDKNPVEVARINAEIEALERQHQLRLGEIRNASIKESQRYTTQMYDSMQSGFASVISKAMQGGLTLSGIFRGLWQAVVQAIINALAQIAAEWLLKTALAKLLGKSQAASDITASAGRAGAAAVASTAAIPIIGPALAPAAGLAASAAAEAFMPAALAPFAQGAWELPSDGPLFAHKGETILPRSFAEDFRNNAKNGGAIAAGGGDVHVHFNGGINDAHSLRRFFLNNKSLVAEALGSARRDNMNFGV